MAIFDMPKDDYGDVFTKEQWEHYVAVGGFIPSDGCGYWGNATHYSFDHNCFRQAPEEATHVHWYNR